MKKEVAEISHSIINNVNSFISCTANGPYDDHETELRITAHVLCICAFLYEIEKNVSLLQPINKLGKRLLHSESYRPNGYTCICRNKETKDKTNGVIGQAWIIEGLIEAYRVTKNRVYISEAEELFLLHEFDDTCCLWHSRDIDGRSRSIDNTFNHQLWFAAIGSLLYEITNNNKIGNQVTEFCKNINRICKIHRNGLFIHQIYPNMIRGKIKFDLKTIREFTYSMSGLPNMAYKENGYHAFNLYALAILEKHGMKEYLPENIIKKSLRYCENRQYMQSLCSNNHYTDVNTKDLKACYLQCNRYGFAYNVTGFEMLYISYVFYKRISLELANEMYNKQIYFTYNEEKHILDRNTEDSRLVTARVYEALRAFAEEKYVY